MTLALTLFQALADSTRLRIFALLRVMPLSVGELAQVLGQSQPRVSRHAKILEQSGLVHKRKEGNWVFLTLGEDHLVAPVFAALAQWNGAPDPEAQADSIRLEAIRLARASAAQAYFETHAAQWDAIRSLHSTEKTVERAILKLVGDTPCHMLVDIGTGTGRMIELLGSRANTIMGCDRSPAMLRVARSKLEQAGLAHHALDLRQSDLCAIPLPTGVADLAVMHQVLHYVPQPAAALAEAARILSKNGRLLVVDFAPHTHEELREHHAHAWLGFSDTQMHKWLHTAGLRCAQMVELKGKLTVRLWLGVRD